MLTRIFFFCVTTMVLVETAAACRVFWEAPEQLEQDAAIVADGVVTSVGKPQTTFRSHRYEYRIRVEHVERGEIEKGDQRVTFEDLLMHRRGNLTVCPIKHGSSIEQHLRIGGRYRFFLRSREDPEILIVACGEGRERCLKQ